MLKSSMYELSNDYSINSVRALIEQTRDTKGSGGCHKSVFDYAQSVANLLSFPSVDIEYKNRGYLLIRTLMEWLPEHHSIESENFALNLLSEIWDSLATPKDSN